MATTLRPNTLLQLRHAAGSSIEVLAGRIWVTEHGRAGDSLLGRGERYHVGGNGLVIVGTEACARDGAEIAVRPAPARAAPSPATLSVKRLLGWIV